MKGKFITILISFTRNWEFWGGLRTGFTEGRFRLQPRRLADKMSSPPLETSETIRGDIDIKGHFDNHVSSVLLWNRWGGCWTWLSWPRKSPLSGSPWKPVSWLYTIYVTGDNLPQFLYENILPRPNVPFLRHYTHVLYCGRLTTSHSVHLKNLGCLKMNILEVDQMIWILGFCPANCTPRHWYSRPFGGAAI